MDEDPYLGAYVELLTRRWTWIVAAAIIAASAAFFFSSLIPPTYEAKSTVASVRSRTDVSFDPRIQTLSEDEIGPRDLAARTAALVALVSTSDIASQVLDEVSARLEPNERSVMSLLQMVEGTNKGDLIEIKTKHQDPDTAALIANHWAESYVQHINDLYRDGNSSGIEAVNLQASAAQGEYEQAQEELQEFVADNEIIAIERDIESKDLVMNAYQAARDYLLAEPINLDVGAKQKILGDYFEDLRRIERWLADAQAFRHQVSARSDSDAGDLGNVIALASLRNQVYGGAAPVQLQVDLSTAPTSPVQVAEVDSLIEVLEARRRATRESIDELTSALLLDEPQEVGVEPGHPLNQRIADLIDETLALQSNLEEQEARQRELVQARDLAWETYQTLVRKQAEEQIAAQSVGTEVRTAASAFPPEEPVSPRRFLFTAVGAMMGLVMASFAIIVIESRNQE